MLFAEDSDEEANEDRAGITTREAVAGERHGQAGMDGRLSYMAVSLKVEEAVVSMFPEVSTI